MRQKKTQEECQHMVLCMRWIFTGNGVRFSIFITQPNPYKYFMHKHEFYREMDCKKNFNQNPQNIYFITQKPVYLFRCMYLYTT